MNPFSWDVPWAVLFGALFVIVFFRSNLFHLIGRGLVSGLAKTRLMAKYFDSAGYKKAQELICRYGAPVVTLCFATVGFQTLVLMASGAGKMPLRKYLPANILGCMLWALIYSTAGMVGFRLIGWGWQRSPALAVAAIALIALAVFIFVRVQREKEPARAKKQPPA